MNKPQSTIPKKTAVHTINKVLEKHPRRSPPPPKQQTVPAALLEMDPTMETSQVYIKSNDYFKENS